MWTLFFNVYTLFKIISHVYTYCYYLIRNIHRQSVKLLNYTRSFKSEESKWLFGAHRVIRNFSSNEAVANVKLIQKRVSSVDIHEMSGRAQRQCCWSFAPTAVSRTEFGNESEVTRLGRQLCSTRAQSASDVHSYPTLQNFSTNCVETASLPLTLLSWYRRRIVHQ